MVTVQQYREAVRANRRWDYCILAAIIYMFAAMVVEGVLLGSVGSTWTQECGQWVVRHDLSPAEFGFITVAACLPVGLVVAAPTIMLLRLGDRRKRRDRRLVCPHCNAFLNTLTMLTGNCCRCGGQALDISTPKAGAADSTHSGTRRLPLAKYRALNSAYFRWALLGAVILLPCFAIAVYCLLTAVENPLVRLVGNVGFGTVAFAMCILALCLGVWVGSVADRRFRRTWHLDCPHCGKSLAHASGIVIATRRCHHCGRRALSVDAAPIARAGLAAG